MFNVSYADKPETVGQHRIRKEQQSTGVSRNSSVQSIGSSDLGQLQSSFFTLFNGKKRSSLQRSGSHSKISSLQEQDSIKPVRRQSSYTHTSELSLKHTSQATKPLAVKAFSPEQTSDYSCTDKSSPTEESIFSAWTGRSGRTTSSWGSAAGCSSPDQGMGCLSPGSIITPATDITVSPRESLKNAEQLFSALTVSSTSSLPVQTCDMPSKAQSKVFSPEFSLAESTPFPKETIADPDSEIFPDSCSATAAIGSEGWKQIRECDQTAPSERTITPISFAEWPYPPDHFKSQSGVISTAELGNLRQVLQHMDSTSPRAILERLRAEWIEVTDAALYRELELEKQLWMLVALRSLNGYKCASVSDDIKVCLSRIGPGAKVSKALSLYENQASSLFLSAVSSASEIHHLSTNPLSDLLYPNVRPLKVSAPSARLPYIANSFTSIHAFSLPALHASSSIPKLLRECHRILTSSTPKSSPLCFTNSTVPPLPPKKERAGTLHLTILDPAPLPATLGPKFRAWLDAHLILNLEKQFRCTSPRRLFPLWLSDARLRAHGSTIAIVRFLATVSSDSSGSDGSDSPDTSAGDSDDEATALRPAMRSTVGRLLWKEMWGPFVQARRWWWDDQAILDECERLGTTWEYAIIEAVKEG